MGTGEFNAAYTLYFISRHPLRYFNFHNLSCHVPGSELVQFYFVLHDKTDRKACSSLKLQYPLFILAQPLNLTEFFLI